MTFLKHRNIIIFIFALAVGLMVSLPQIWTIRLMGDDYQGIMPIGGGDDLYYLARAREVLDGHPNLSNPYLLEYKDAPAAPFWIPDYLLAKFSFVFNGRLDYTFWFFDFFLSAAAIVLSFILFKKVTGNFWISLASLTGFYLGLVFDNLGRTPSPQFNFLFWLWFLISWVYFINEPKLKYLISASLSAGALFYVYPYYWTLGVVWGFFLLTGAAWFLRSQFPWRQVFYALILTAGLSAPYWIQFISIAKHPWSEETLVRLGLIYSRFPSGLALVSFSALVFIALLWTFRRRFLEINSSNLAVASGTIASIVTVNSHLITNKNLEFSSHYWQTGMFFVVLALAVLIAALIKKKLVPSKDQLGLGVFLLILAVSLPSAVSIIRQEGTPEDNEKKFQDYASLINWINMETKKEDVFLAGEELSSLIPIYTSGNVFYSRFANLHYLPNTEVRRRFIINHLAEEPTDNFVEKYERSIWGTQFINRYSHDQRGNLLRRLLGMNLKITERLPRGEVEKFQKEFLEAKNSSWKKLVGSRQINYVIWDKKKEKQPLIGWHYFMSKIWETDQFIVFKLL